MHEDASATPVVLSIPAMRPAPLEPALFSAESEADAQIDIDVPIVVGDRREPRLASGARLPGEQLAHDRAYRGLGAPQREVLGEVRAPLRIEGASRRAAAMRTPSNTGWWAGSFLLGLVAGRADRLRRAGATAGRRAAAAVAGSDLRSVQLPLADAGLRSTPFAWSAAKCGRIRLRPRP